MRDIIMTTKYLIRSKVGGGMDGQTNERMDKMAAERNGSPPQDSF